MEDGLRISVMSRHTLNDGKTIDNRIMAGVTFNEHRIELAPPPKIVGEWYKSQRSQVDWDNFTCEYLEHLDKPRPSQAVRELTETALRRNVTILCVEPRGEKCHRIILAQRCKEIQPRLEVRHV